MLSNALLDRVKEQLISTGAGLTEVEITQALRNCGALESGNELIMQARLIRSQLIGYGPLEHLLTRPEITDILVHGDGRVFIDSPAGMEFVGKLFADSIAVRNFAQRLAIQAKRRLDDAQPWVDAKLADGNRLHAVLPPIAVGGAQVSIRIPSRTPFSLDRLQEIGAISAAARTDLVELIESSESFLVVGGTGVGKTSLLASLLGLVDHNQRIIVVEESSELAIVHPHLVQLEAKHATTEGVGAVSLQDLIRQTLRMRPDRIVIGEIRGSEVFELLLAINTGHTGSAATLHANNATEVVSRITALGLLADISPALSKEWLLSGINKVVELKRIGNRRIVSAIAQSNPTVGGYEIVARYHTKSNLAAA